jgi:adenosylhomocysteine nucleosidase
MKVVAIISANAEWRAVKEIYPELALKPSPFGEFADLTLGAWELTLFHGGWGKISAAATAQYIIDTFQPDLLLNLGTCGGFAGQVETGTIILVERTLVYDILEQMGDGAAAIEHYSTTLDLSWLRPDLPYAVPRGLLVSADRDLLAEDIPLLAEKYGAVAADWESGAIAWVADRNGMPCLILRAVSDLVGEGGGEAYGNLELFHDRTGVVLRELFRQLPDWLGAVSLGVKDSTSE